jgi:hypothetical protein
VSLGQQRSTRAGGGAIRFSWRRILSLPSIYSLAAVLISSRDGRKVCKRLPQRFPQVSIRFVIASLPARVLTLSQSFDLPDTYKLSARFATKPSSCCASRAANKSKPLSIRWSVNLSLPVKLLGRIRLRRALRSIK